jgi:hypothetical protein
MEDSDSTDYLKKAESTGITRVSNDLVKRSIEDLVKLNSDINSIIKSQRILINADRDIGGLMISALKKLYIEANRIECYRDLDVVYLELSRHKYEMIILTNSAMTETEIRPLIPEIKKRFPGIKILVISSDTRDDYIKDLFDLKIEGFLPMPFLISSFLDIVAKQFSIINTSNLDGSYLKTSKKNTPEIILNAKGIIKISGPSISEHSTLFYEPIINWINKYISDPSDFTRVDIFLDIVNGASKKNILMILQKITYLRAKHKSFIINWYYHDSDEEMLQLGKEFSSSLDQSFNFIPVNSSS